METGESEGAGGAPGSAGLPTVPRAGERAPRGPLSRIGLLLAKEEAEERAVAPPADTGSNDVSASAAMDADGGAPAAAISAGPVSPAGPRSRVPSPKSRVTPESRKKARAVFSMCAALIAVELIWPGALEAPFYRAWYGTAVAASTDTTAARARDVLIRSFTIDPSLHAAGQPFLESAWLERATRRRSPQAFYRIPPSLLCVRITFPGHRVDEYQLSDGRRTAFLPGEGDPETRSDSKRLVFLAPLGRPPYTVTLTGPTGSTTFELR